MLYFLYLILFLLLSSVLLLGAYQIYANFLQPGAIYYPTTNPSVSKMLKLSRVGHKDTLIDIGSGDGRILIAAARLGATCIGYEINPFLVWRSRQYIRQAKLDRLATVHWKSFWQADFNQATIITVYLSPHLMNRLQYLLEKKLDHSIRVVTNDYSFPKLIPAKHHRRIYLYNFAASTH